MNEVFCPKCGHRHLPVASPPAECARCGIVFAKYRQHLQDKAAGKAPQPRQAMIEGWRERLYGLLLGAPAEASSSKLYGEGLLWLGLLLWGGHFVFSRWQNNVAGMSFLHGVNLPFHEFGHILFRPFGEWLCFLGGSLFQCMVPLLLLGVFVFREQQRFPAAVCLWWAGENLLDVAPYIGDARDMALSLVGEYSEDIAEMRPLRHDWHNILEPVGLLAWDHRLASLAHGLGAMVMLLALVWGGWCLWQDHLFLRDNHGH